MNILLIANSNVLPLRLVQIDISLLENTLLDIPEELIDIISYESFKIAQYEKKLDMNHCINAHNDCGLKCHVLCHLCEINIATIFFDAGGSHISSCCNSCYIERKYQNCIICDKYDWDNYQYIFKYEYVREILPFKTNYKYSARYIGDCNLCYDEQDESCIKCKVSNGNLIKCYHYCLQGGKKIIYFCNHNCALSRYRDEIDEKITIFENLRDRCLIEKRVLLRESY